MVHDVGQLVGTQPLATSRRQPAADATDEDIPPLVNASADNDRARSEARAPWWTRTAPSSVPNARSIGPRTPSGSGLPPPQAWAIR